MSRRHTTLTLRIPGQAAPQGSKKHVGNGVLVESSTRARTWRTVAIDTIDRAVTMQNWTRPEGPVAVTVTFAFDKPKSAPKRKRWWPITRSSGDIDKLARCLLDALEQGGAIRDDAQVIHLVASKGVGEPHTVVEVVDLGGFT